jgi:threonine/homoserine/homoserine lactone efflux protein
MMPGPVFAMTIAQGFRSKTAGVVIALGHGLVEFPLMFLIYFGFAQFFADATVQKTIGFVGGLMLVYMGIQTFRARKKLKEQGNLKHSSLVVGILTTVANPYFFIWWATIGLALIVQTYAFGFFGFLLFSVTHWSCDLGWDSLVSLTVFKSKRLWTERTQTLVFGFCFVVLVGFGTWFIMTALL